MDPVTRWDVVVLGGINTDYLVRGPALPGPGMSLNGDDFHEAAGGKGANAAVAAARLGARTALVGRVGDDVQGRALIEHLTRMGVHAAHVGLDVTAPTGAAVIQVDRQGKKQILAALGASLRLQVSDVEAAAETIRASRVLVTQLEVPVECVGAAISIAADAGVRVVLDPAPPAPLPDEVLARVDVVRANRTEVEALTGLPITDESTAREGARALLARGCRHAIVEAGKGNLLVWDAGEHWFPELPVQAVDTTGAGDAFTAGLAVALAEGQAIIDAVQLASSVSALATTAFGAQDALPSREQLRAFMQSQRARIQG